MFTKAIIAVEILIRGPLAGSSLLSYARWPRFVLPG
jgi:hypothetical protein